MIYGSVCSGIEAASVAWHPLGWRAAFLSEIEAFPRAVLAHHYPDVPLHGDFTTIGAEDYAAIDVLVGGTPCQSFSVAGLRKGLDDERGNLALEFCLLARRLSPRWVIWENVPGVLSMDKGRAFASILGGLAECGYGLAYRVLDAQFVRVDGFGRAVPQRRRRVFVVGHLGDWRRAAAVLFERASLSRHPPPRRQAGERAAKAFEIGSGGGSEISVNGTLDARCRDGPIRNQLGTCVAHTLNAKGGAGRSDSESESESETFLPVAHAFRADGFDASEDGTGRGTPLVPVQAIPFATHGAEGRNGGGIGLLGDPMMTLQADERHGVATGPLDTDGSTQGILTSWRVRRLTPVECERLQGFPDGYTAIPYRGKPAADGPRYKALGNSMAVNVMRWIGRRIAAVETV